MAKIIVINKNECNSCCECLDIAPDIFDINIEGVFIKMAVKQSEDINNRLQFAIDNCNQFCLSWQDEASNSPKTVIKEKTFHNKALSLSEGLDKLKSLDKNYLLKPLQDDSSGIWYHQEKDNYLLYPYIPYGVNSIDFCFSDKEDNQYEIVEKDLTETYQVFDTKLCHSFDTLIDVFNK